jgi:hypothetical protein
MLGGSIGKLTLGGRNIERKYRKLTLGGSIGKLTLGGSIGKLTLGGSKGN